jgi:hypothetical protein
MAMIFGMVAVTLISFLFGWTLWDLLTGGTRRERGGPPVVRPCPAPRAGRHGLAVIDTDSKVRLQATRPKPGKLGPELRWRFRQNRRAVKQLLREGG